MTTEGSGVRRLRLGESTLDGSDRSAATDSSEIDADATDADAADADVTDAGADDANGTTAILARFARPRTDDPTTLAVVADPHLSTEKEGTWKVFHRTEDRLRAALADAEARGVDGVVFAGDLTEDGHSADFERVADLLADLSVPWVAVPGNHDVPKAFKNHGTPPVSQFEERFTPGELPFRKEFGGVDVLGLNSASAPDGSLDATHDGALSAAQLDWLESTLPDTDAALVVTHHNLAGLDACIPADGYAPHPPVGEAESLAETLAEHDALHVSGHIHLPAVTEVECGGVGVPGFVAPALSSYPQAYTLAEIGPEGTTLRLVPVADSEGVAEAWELAKSHSARSEDVAEMVERQLAALPLADER